MNKAFWIGMLIVTGIMLLMLLLSYPFLEPGTPTYVVFQLALVHVLAAMGILSTIIYFDLDPFKALR